MGETGRHPSLKICLLFFGGYQNAVLATEFTFNLTKPIEMFI